MGTVGRGKPHMKVSIRLLEWLGCSGHQNMCRGERSPDT